MDLILKNTFQKISPAYELVADITVGTATTFVDITGLTIGKDDELFLVSDVYNPTASDVNYRLFVNNNTTATNYYFQRINADNASASGNRANDSSIAYAYSTPSRYAFSYTRIKLANSGYTVAQSCGSYTYGGTDLYLSDRHVTTTFTAFSLSSVRVSGSATNSIGVGSRFQLYKLVAKKIADIIVSSNTTSLDISGLNIDKNGEYYLVSDIISGANSDYYLYANNNTTATNYYSQRITVNLSTLGGSRSNDSNILDASSGNKSLIMSNIKLSNSGYLVSQNNSSENYGGSGLMLNKHYTTTTFTADPVTKLTITASAANGIAANSRFTLYKMK